MSHIIAFHYGNFDNHYVDGTRANAAKNGRIYADTTSSELPSEYGTINSASTASGQTTYSWTPLTDGTVDVLIAAGGGGGGGTIGGGGGAGGLIYKPDQTLSSSSYTIKVGDGGQGGNGWQISSTVGKPGYDSVFDSYTANGGGGGYSYDYTTVANGGSGGGGANKSANGGTGSQPDGYGNNGGNGGDTNYGAGGGGALTKGGDVDSTNLSGGVGGTGKDLSHRFGSIYGDDGFFCGGGGGAVRSGSSRVAGDGGKGGGGNATSYTIKADDGQEHSGGGGGGGGYNGSASGSIIGGHGGSGIVLLRIQYTPKPPPVVQGLVGWYTANSAELSSGSVNRWKDLSGKGNHVESGAFNGNVKRADLNDSNATNRVCVETPVQGGRIVSFHYGNFSSNYSHTDSTAAAKNGVICANTNVSDIPEHFGTFTISGTASGQTTYSWTPPNNCTAEVLVVAGGGGGGGVISGGGGGGGLILHPNLNLNGGVANTVKVGDGGLGATGWNTSRQDGKPGYDSVFGSLTAKGGGGGVHHGGNTTSTTKDGGSGGGGGNAYSGVGGNATQSSQSGDSGTYGYGYDGGDNGDGNWGSGGGGAGGLGGNTDRSTISGAGGIGKYIKFSGNYGDDGWFSGGGSGGTRDRGTISAGGKGGGGVGTKTSSRATDGQEHTGGGGGGAGYNGSNSGQLGGNGGSGVVIVKFYVSDGKGQTKFPFLYGTTADGLRFPSTTMDTSSDYTLFHVTRYYKTSGTPSRGRIFDGVTSNWLSGFYSGNSGVAYHDGWLTSTTNIHGDNWILSVDQKDLYRSNGVDRTVSGSGSTSKQLSINYGYYSSTEPSDWAVSEVIIYNRELTLAEYLSVETYLKLKYFQIGVVPNSGTISGSLINAIFYDGQQSPNGTTGYPISLGRLGVRIENTLNTLLNAGDFRNIGVKGALDSVSSINFPVVAFSFRRLFGHYSGPQVRVKRSTDSAEADIYMDSTGVIELISGSTLTDFNTWLNGGTGSIMIWYDQTGAGRNATRTRRNTSYGTAEVKKSSGNTTLHMDIQPVSTDFIEFDALNLGTDDYTFVLGVKTPSAITRWRTYLRGQDRHHYLLLEDEGYRVGFYDNTSTGFNVSGLSHTVSTKYVYSSMASGGQTIIRQNGTSGTTINRQLPEFFKQRMMLTYPGQGSGETYEMIFYVGAQTTSFVQSVETIVEEIL